MKTILFIGSRGFIGRKLKRKLKNKFKLICLNRKNGFNISRPNNFEKLIDKKIDIILNLSGQVSKKNSEMKKTIIDGNKNIIKFAKEKKNIIVYFFSTSLVYGYSKKTLNEKSKTLPSSIYAKMKRAAEIQYLNSNINFKILRIASVYDENKGGIVKNIINGISQKKKIIITNKNVYRNYIHINDLIKIMIKILEKKLKKKIYNIGNENIMIKKIIYQIEKTFNKKIIYLNKKISLKKLSSQKIYSHFLLNEIKYTPRVNLISFIKKKLKNEF